MKISVKETVDPIPYIYQQNMVEISTQANRDIVAAHLPTIPVLYRIRRERVPPLPKYRSELHFEGEWTRTHNKNDRMISSTTSDKLGSLSNDKIDMDCIFQTCPSLFYQIFTLHAFKNGKKFPFADCLLPGKSRLIYPGALELLILKAGEISFNLKPTEVVMDFEIALIQAVQLAFPLTKVRGCFFHFTQAINRKLNTLGLQITYREDESIGQFFRKTAALAFVPVHLVLLAWQDI